MNAFSQRRRSMMSIRSPRRLSARTRRRITVTSVRILVTSCRWDGPALKCAAYTELSLVVNADGDTISIHCLVDLLTRIHHVQNRFRSKCTTSKACAGRVPSSLLNALAHINVTVTSEIIMKYSVYDVFASETASSASLLRVFSAIIQQVTFNPLAAAVTFNIKVTIKSHY